MRKSGVLAVSAIFMTAVAAGAPRAGSYRIELSNGSQVIALDAPVRRGTVVTFHNSGGALTGVPSEMIVRVVQESGKGTASASAARKRPVLAATQPDMTVARPPATGLQPGEVLVIGPTGDGAILANANGAAGAAGQAGVANDGVANNGVANNGMGAYGYGGGINPNAVKPNVAINPNLTTIGPDGLPRVASSTDLSRAQAAQTTMGPNGFPVTTNTGVPTVIGPNGTPTLAPGVPGSAATTVIGPNGTPVTSTGSPQMVIGPNGTPVMAQSGQPGSAQPVVGPNGTPVLAPQSQPGSVAPNGTPQNPPGGAATAPSGGSVAPNGAPQSSPKGAPQSSPNGAPQSSPNGAPQSSPSGSTGPGAH